MAIVMLTGTHLRLFMLSFPFNAKTFFKKRIEVLILFLSQFRSCLHIFLTLEQLFHSFFGFHVKILAS